MTRRRFAQSALLIKTLVLFDGPQLALFRSDRNRYMLAVACEKDGYDFPFFAAEVGDATLRRYMDEKIDLNYAMRLREAFKQYFFFDWRDLHDMEVPLTKALQEEVKDNLYYPEPGFFSRTHTADFDLGYTFESEAKSFGIDGSWDASDFSRFYDKIADIYAFTLLTSKNLQERIGSIDMASIRGTISRQAWRGGGSYVSFYSQLFDSVHSLTPLNISKIQYASPGYIEVNGGAQSLDGIADIIYNFNTYSEHLRDNYNYLKKILQRDGLLSSGRERPFSSPALERLAWKTTGIFANRLGIDDSEELFRICGENTVVYSKVVLSYYRRARDLHKFYAEGRVSL